MDTNETKTVVLDEHTVAISVRAGQIENGGLSWQTQKIRLSPKGERCGDWDMKAGKATVSKPSNHQISDYCHSWQSNPYL